MEITSSVTSIQWQLFEVHTLLTKDSNATHSTLPCHLVFPLVDPCLPAYRRGGFGNFHVKRKKGTHVASIVLGGGFRYFLFSSLFGEMIQYD